MIKRQERGKMELGKRLRKCKTVDTREVNDFIERSARKITYAARRQCLIADELPEDVQNAIRKEAFETLRVERSLKEYFQILADHYVLKEERVTLGDMEREFFFPMRKILERIMDVEMYFPRNDTLSIMVDQERLEYALLELIRNVEQHADHEPDKPCSIRIWVSQSESSIRFSVADNGAGMSEEELEHCCEPGFTMSEDRNSLGLGLCMVRYFAKASRGKFQITSEKGKGTTAKLVLPKEPKDTESIVSSPKTAEPIYPNPIEVMLNRF